MSEPFDLIAAAGKKSKGRRPYFLESKQTEQVLSVVMAVAQELAVLRERQDTLERLLEQAGVLAAGAIDAFAPDAKAAAERGTAMQLYLARILRILQQDAEAQSVASEPSAEEVSSELGR